MHALYIDGIHWHIKDKGLQDNSHSVLKEVLETKFI